MSVLAIIAEIVLPTLFYVGMAVYTFGRVAAAVAWQNARLYGVPDWGDGIIAGLVNAPFWPIALPIWASIWYARSHEYRRSFIFRPPPHLRDLQRAAYERRIRELERQAGIS